MGNIEGCQRSLLSTPNPSQKLLPDIQSRPRQAQIDEQLLLRCRQAFFARHNPAPRSSQLSKVPLRRYRKTACANGCGSLPYSRAGQGGQVPPPDEDLERRATSRRHCDWMILSEMRLG